MGRIKANISLARAILAYNEEKSRVLSILSIKTPIGYFQANQLAQKAYFEELGYKVRVKQ